MNEEELKNIADQIKANLPIEVLDQLERQYNEIYKKLKEQHEQSGSIQKID
jgi:ribonuclease HIII